MSPRLGRLSTPRRRPSLIAGVGLAILLLAAPTFGAATGGDPVRGLNGPTVTLPSGAAVAAPTAVAGATMGTVGLADAVVYGTAAGTTVVSDGAYYEYNSTAGGPILAALRLPAGATLWQIDVYGYTTGATTQSWALFSQDGASGSVATVGSGATTGSGPGTVQGTMTFAGGVSLAAGHTWLLDLFDTSASSAFVGAVFQYTMPTVSLVPINPTRVYDSRCTGGVLARGATRTVSVATAVNSSTCATGATNVVPAGAKAIAYNLTITQTVNSGNLSIYPTGGSSSASAINWFATGQTLANAAIVQISSGRQVSVTAGGTTGSQTHFIIDITGYYK